jgi:transposase
MQVTPSVGNPAVFDYYPLTGLPKSVTRGGEKLEVAYQGSLPLSLIQTGVVNATLSISYNQYLEPVELKCLSFPKTHPHLFPVILEHFTFLYLRRYTVGMRPTSVDLRKRVVAARFEDGQSMGEISERFRIPKGTVQNILERYREGGTVEPRAHNAGRKPAFSPQALQRLERDVERHPDATLAELRERSGVRVSLVAFHRTLKRLGFTRKKSLYARVNSSGPM